MMNTMMTFTCEQVTPGGSCPILSGCCPDVMRPATASPDDDDDHDNDDDDDNGNDDDNDVSCIWMHDTHLYTAVWRLWLTRCLPYSQPVKSEFSRPT